MCKLAEEVPKKKTFLTIIFSDECRDILAVMAGLKIVFCENSHPTWLRNQHWEDGVMFLNLYCRQ